MPSAMPDDEAGAVSWSTGGRAGIDGVCQARPQVNESGDQPFGRADDSASSGGTPTASRGRSTKPPCQVPSFSDQSRPDRIHRRHPAIDVKITLGPRGQGEIAEANGLAAQQLQQGGMGRGGVGHRPSVRILRHPAMENLRSAACGRRRVC
jgi:hypothetical protein